MNSLRRLLLTGVVAVLLATAFDLAASGSYTGRPPQPGASGRAHERALYALGQRIFTGKVKPAATVEAAPQAGRLQKLQATLPEKTAARTDLTALAGKLEEEQLEALEFYVNKRYGK